MAHSVLQSKTRTRLRLFSWNTARLALGLSLLVLLALWIDWSEFWSLLRTINPAYVLMAFSLNLINIGLSAWRWKILLRSDGTHVPVWRLMRYYLISQFFNNYLPPFVGADAVRMLAVRESKSSGGRVVPVLIERGIGLFALLLLGAVAVLLSPALRQHTGLCIIVAVALLGTLGALTALLFPRLWLWATPLTRRFPRLNDILMDVAQTGSRYRQKRVVLAATLAISLGIQLLVVAAFYLRACAFDIHVEIGQMFLVAPVITLLTLIPISPGGIGTQESFFALTFGTIGIGESMALAMALLARFLDLMVSLIGAILWLQTPWKKQTE